MIVFGKKFKLGKSSPCHEVFLLGQWLNFKLFRITYVVGKKNRSNFFFSGSIG